MHPFTSLIVYQEEVILESCGTSMRSSARQYMVDTKREPRQYMRRDDRTPTKYKKTPYTILNIIRNPISMHCAFRYQVMLSGAINES